MKNEDILKEEAEILESIKEEEKKERELLEKIENEEERIEEEEKKIEDKEETIEEMEKKIEEEIEEVKGTETSALIRWKQEIWEDCKYKSEKLTELEVAFLCKKTGKPCTYRDCPLIER